MGDAAQLVHIPLVHGQQEAVDAKMLPAGWLTECRNVRLRKDNRFGSRFGYAFVATAPGAAVAAGNVGPKLSVYVKERASSTVPAKWFTRGSDGNYSTPAPASCVGTLGVPRRVALVRNTQFSCLACDFAQVGDYTFTVYQDADYDNGTISGITLLIHNVHSGALVSRSLIGGVADSNPKIVVIGTTVMAFFARNTDDTVRAFIVDSSSLTTSTATVVTAHAGRAFAFDVAPSGGTACLLTYQSSAVALKWGTVSAGGVYTNSATQAIANPVRPTVSLDSSGIVVVLAWAEGATFNDGDLCVRTDTITAIAVTAKAIVDTGVNGFPAVGPNAGYRWTIAYRVADSLMRFYSGGTGVADSVGFLTPVSKPFTGPNGECLVWTVNFADADQLGAGVFGTYKLIDVASAFDLGTSAVAICEAVACQRAALPGGYYTTNAAYQKYVDPRRFVVSLPSTLTCPSPTAVGGVFPVITENNFGADLIRIDSSTYADQFLPCNINGQLLFSGPRVREFDGSIIYESGLADGPEQITAIDGGASAGTGLEAGDHQVTVTWEWHDAAGRRHRSPPTLPITVSVTAAHYISVGIPCMAFSDRTGGNGADAGVYAKIWVTEVNGTVFHLVNQTRNFPLPTLDGSYRTYLIDNLSDAQMESREVLYTQGDRGAISGSLPNDEPPPCRFLWAGSDRVIAGGLEDPTKVQWSRPIFPGEPVQWSIEPEFTTNVDEEVTGVAQLDGSWIIFTARSVWIVDGAGPDDNAVGEFAAPRKLPSETGCTSFRSIVDSSLGIFFQGIGERMYLLPRGGNAPQWIGQPMRDTFADSFIVAGKALLAENCIAWLCNFDDLSASFVVIYDTRANEWMYDYIPGAPLWSAPRSAADVYDGKLILDGSIAETDDFTDNHDGATPKSFSNVLTLGDVRPFGPEGWGRVRRMIALGELRTLEQVQVLLEVSYDSGQNFETSDTWTIDGTVSQRRRFEHPLKTVRGDSFRPRLTAQPASATIGSECMVFNDITLETFPSPGTPRLGAGDRK